MNKSLVRFKGSLPKTVGNVPGRACQRRRSVGSAKQPSRESWLEITSHTSSC